MYQNNFEFRAWSMMIFFAPCYKIRVTLTSVLQFLGPFRYVPCVKVCVCVGVPIANNVACFDTECLLKVYWFSFGVVIV